jgi:hypothetical protein
LSASQKEITNSIRNPTYRNNPTNKALSQAHKKLGKPKKREKKTRFDETKFVERETSEAETTGVCVKNGVAMRVKPNIRVRHDDAPMLVLPADALTSEERAHVQIASAAAAVEKEQREEKERFLVTRYSKDEHGDDAALPPNDPPTDALEPGSQRPLFTQQSSSDRRRVSWPLSRERERERKRRRKSKKRKKESKKQRHPPVNKSLLSFGDDD